jgi:hypothetical protein
VSIALAVGVVLGCHRSAPPTAEVGGAGGGATAPRTVARHQAPFAHPLLAGATTEVTHEDCSRPALLAVVARTLAIEVEAAPTAPRQRSKPGTNEGCPSPAAADLGKIVRGELLPRVGGCVARDGPLDPEWDMVNSAVLSLGVCLDCRRARDEQVTQCRRAHDVLQRATQTPR